MKNTLASVTSASRTPVCRTGSNGSPRRARRHASTDHAAPSGAPSIAMLTSNGGTSMCDHVGRSETPCAAISVQATRLTACDARLHAPTSIAIVEAHAMIVIAASIVSPGRPG
jgi:hypothetical protein